LALAQVSRFSAVWLFPSARDLTDTHEVTDAHKLTSYAIGSTHELSI
jgi:hypothetical protein